jgi:hypothetical protein
VKVTEAISVDRSVTQFGLIIPITSPLTGSIFLTGEAAPCLATRRAALLGASNARMAVGLSKIGGGEPDTSMVLLWLKKHS